jgi:lipoprotein-releasing system permease protein
MRESLELWLAWRHLRAKRSERFISLITWLSAAGVAVGVAALIVVYSVMTGYTETLRDKIVGMNAHVTVYALRGNMADEDDVPGHLRKMEGVVSASPFVMGQAILAAPGAVKGALIRGIDPKDPEWLASIGNNIVAGNATTLRDGSPSLLLGKELASQLKLHVGDTVGATVPVGGAPRLRSFRVVGIFSTGMYEYDSKLAVASLDTARSLLGLGKESTGVEVRVADLMAADVYAQTIGKALGPSYWVADWKRLNRNMFFALELQRVVLSLILGLIVLVAAFNVAATLIMVVLEKTREIGILKAMGAPNRSIRRIFTAQGLLIGVVGAAGGLALGLGVCELLARYPLIKIPSDIYLFDRLPVIVRPAPCALFALTAVALCYLATLYPSWQASRLNPVDAIRTE